MDALQALTTRRSVRSFLEQPVEFEKLSAIFEAARNAPSAGNIQPCRIILVTDKKMREQLADACKRQTWIANAPMLLVAVIEPQPTERMFPDEGIKFARQDAAAAITNILHAAHAQGLGACWVGAFVSSIVAQLLEIPDRVEIVGVVALGYPAEDQPEAPPKMGIEHIVFIEKWGNKLVNMAAFARAYAERMAKQVAGRVLGLFKK